MFLTCESLSFSVRCHVVREGNETLFIKVWKSLPSRRVLKTSHERDDLKRTLSASGGLDCYILNEPYQIHALICLSCSIEQRSCEVCSTRRSRLEISI